MKTSSSLIETQQQQQSLCWGDTRKSTIRRILIVSAILCMKTNQTCFDDSKKLNRENWKTIHFELPNNVWLLGYQESEIWKVGGTM